MFGRGTDVIETIGGICRGSPRLRLIGREDSDDERSQPKKLSNAERHAAWPRCDNASCTWVGGWVGVLGRGRSILILIGSEEHHST